MKCARRRIIKVVSSLLYEKLLDDGQFDIEGNDTKNKVRVAAAGPPKKAVDVRKQLFEYFVDVRTAPKGRLPQNLFLAKAKFFYDQYCNDLRKDGEEPPKPDLVFSRQWLKGWCQEYQVSMKMPNKRFKIPFDVRKERILDFLKNVWTVRHAFMEWYNVDPPIVMSDQMPLHTNECAHTKSLNFKGQTQTTFVKENHMLSRERITVMTSVSSFPKVVPPNLEFVFKGVGTRTKLNPPPKVSFQWAPKGSYRLEHMQSFVGKVVPEVPVMFSPKLRRIFTLDDYSVHLDPSISDKLVKRGYFPNILGVESQVTFK